MAQPSTSLITPTSVPIFSESDLRPYQRDLADFFKATPKSAAWVDMRMGKTAALLTAFKEMYEEISAHKMIVFAPDFVVKDTVWPRECLKWAHLGSLNCVTIHNAHDIRNHDLRNAYNTADVTITSYTNLLWIMAVMRDAWCWDVVTFDEAHAFKSISTKRFSVAKHIIEYFDPRVYQLTGTSTSSGGLLNLYPQIYLLDQGKSLGTTFDSYQRRFFHNPDRRGYKWEPFEESKDDIYKKVEPFVYRLDAKDYDLFDDVEYLPPWTAEFTPELRETYKELEREYLLEFELDTEADVEAVNSAVLSSKLLQFCDGAVYDETGQVHHFHDIKLDLLENLIETCNDRLLVAYNYTFSLDMIKDRFPHAVHAKDKNALDRWRRGEIDLLISHAGSLAYGLDLWGEDGKKPICHTFCWFGSNWSLVENKQFEARLKHPSQDVVLGHRLMIEDSRDGDVVTALESGAQTQEELYTHMNNATKKRLTLR